LQLNEANSSLIPLVIYFLSVLGLTGIVILLAWVIGGKIKRRPATGEPFESGIVSVGNARIPITVEFYLIAMFFVIFDLETVFIFAWAVAFKELGWAGYVATVIFVFILVLALVYEWKSGALDWGIKTRKGLEKK
jgi:NADH-quinone oxidoreductase subunit A